MSHFPDSPNLIIGWFKDELNAQAYKAVYGIKEKLTNYYHAHEFMTEDFNLIVDAVTDLLHKDRAEVRRDALLEAAKENCLYCRHGDKPKFKMRWHHTDSNGVVFGVCQSDKIYRLMAADQSQGQGKE